MSDCRFGVSPVNYPDPDHEKEIRRRRHNILNLLLPQGIGVSVHCGN